MSYHLSEFWAYCAGRTVIVLLLVILYNKIRWLETIVLHFIFDRNLWSTTDLTAFKSCLSKKSEFFLAFANILNDGTLDRRGVVRFVLNITEPYPLIWIFFGYFFPCQSFIHLPYPAGIHSRENTLMNLVTGFFQLLLQRS